MKRMSSLFAVLTTAVLLLTATTLQAAPGHNFVAHLNGAQEVANNPVVTKAQGQAIFNLSRDGNSIRYRLIVANIENVRMAHIHLAPADGNGPVVVWLYPEGPPAQLIPGRVNGVLAIGTISEDDLIGPLAGFTIDELIGQMLDGNAYVNVHTDQYPAGEIRGQIK